MPSISKLQVRRPGAWLMLTLVLLGACELDPLTSSDLRNPPTHDATIDGAIDTAADGANDVPSAATPCDRPEGVCTGSLSGTVLDGCTLQAMAALVGIAGQRQCSFDVKGGYYFPSLPTRVSLTLAAGKAGYRSWSDSIVIASGGTSLVTIILHPAAPYTCDNPPPLTACICDGPGCE